MRLRIASERILHESMDGEVVILDQARGLYYSLTGAGVDAWELLASPATVEEIVLALEARFPDARAEVGRAMRELIAELHGETLLVEADGAAAAPPSDARPARPYAAPKLEKFSDLQNLLLLDPIHDVEGEGWPKSSKIGG